MNNFLFMLLSFVRIFFPSFNYKTKETNQQNNYKGKGSSNFKHIYSGTGYNKLSQPKPKRSSSGTGISLGSNMQPLRWFQTSKGIIKPQRKGVK